MHVAINIETPKNLSESGLATVVGQLETKKEGKNKGRTKKEGTETSHEERK
jgi:hypothetical protein